jgi:hypothetical protein
MGSSEANRKYLRLNLLRDHEGEYAAGSIKFAVTCSFFTLLAGMRSGEGDGTSDCYETLATGRSLPQCH